MNKIERTSTDKVQGASALAELIFELYEPGTAVYAKRVGTGYEPAVNLQTKAKLPLTREAVEAHLSNQQPIGVYPVAPGADVCHFGVLDFDDHDGTTRWPTVRAKALAVAQTLKAEGIAFLAFRSGGGKGIHLLLPFDGPVRAAALRKKMRSILAQHELKDGTASVAEGQVEIFPKQDRNGPGKIGNLIALPLARHSVLLDEGLEVFKGDVLARLQSTRKNPASRISEEPGEEGSAPPPAAEVGGALPNPDKHPLMQCEFIQHCIKNPKIIGEPLWVAAGSSAARAPQGRAFFHFLSKQDRDRYSHEDTDQKFDHARTLQPYSCSKIGELGFPCPKMNPDGSCSITQGTSPASFVVPASALIESLRNVKKAHVRNRRIGMVVQTQLIQNGAFFLSKADQERLYFERAEKRLYRIGTDSFSAYLCDTFGLNSSEQEFNFVLAEVETHALRYGAPQDVHRVAHFSGEALYVDAGRQRMYRLDGKKIASLANGDDGILFRDSDRTDPFTFSAISGTGDVRVHLVDQLHTTNTEAKDLFHVYLYAMYFEKLLPTKPIVLITGEKGSGKSFAGRAIKKVLIGAKADVDIGVAADERSARAAFTHNYFVCMDNVDGMVDWLGNLLASVSTGAVIRMATLYKTNQESEFEPHCFVMINSRDPASLRRDDIADRLLILEVDRHTKFIPESQILGELALKRGAIRSEMLVNLNRIVAKLKKEKTAAPSAQRLADFAVLAGTIARVLKLPGAMRALQKMDETRNSFVLDGDPLIGALLNYTVEPDRPEWIATGPLFAVLETYGDFGRMTARSFGRKLKNVQSNLVKHLTIEWRSGLANTKEVKITPTEKARAELEERLGLNKQVKQ